MEYIEDTIRTEEDLNNVKQQIVNRIVDKSIKQIRLSNAKPFKITLDFNGENYNLKAIVMVFKDDIKAKIYDMFAELEHICFPNTTI